MQFYLTCLNKSLLNHISLPTYARKLVFSFKVAKTAHLYLHEKELCHKNVRKKKTTAELLITDLLIIDKFSVLNFNCIAVRIGIENTSDEV